MTILLCASLVLVMYSYLGYPLLLWLLVEFQPRDIRKGKIQPFVSIIIAARNEADKIRKKIDNTLALTYPREAMEVLVASDASDDGTDDIVQEYSANGVRLIRSPHRAGKEYAQGLAVGVAKGDIVVFTDAATLLEAEALMRLVENFADPDVGAVSTEDQFCDASGKPTGEGLYVAYEMWVRRLESRFQSLIGLSGSCFAIRKELCTEWSTTLASDFRGALQAARNGFRSVADPSVTATISGVTSARRELRRKVRTFLRGITVLMANRDMLNPFRYGRFAFQLASHKMLRFIAPFLLLIVLVSSGSLMDEHPFQLLFWAQVGMTSLGIVGCLVPQLQRNRPVRVIAYFVLVQWAMLIAWGKYLRGEQQVVWEPSKRPAIGVCDSGPTN